MMKPVLVLVLCVIAVPAMAVDMYHSAVGPPHRGEVLRDPEWVDPPDLNGLIASSEQILMYGLETEVANDFVLQRNAIDDVEWWGGYWNNSIPCDPGMTPSGFNLRFYEDAGCVPGTIVADIALTDYTQESVGCQDGNWPLFKWSGSASVPVQAQALYWFSAQMRDHYFPPQSGRLAAMGIQGCDTVFKSAYFGYPDWTPAIDVFGVAFDASQAINVWGIPPPTGACCIGDQGDCRMTYEDECGGLGGVYQGDHTICDPNPCFGVPTKSTTWGRIKGQFR